MAALAAIGLLFALDPGGVIAESGFPDTREMGWKQQVVWGFRTIGVVIAQLLIIALWFWPKYRPPQASPWYSGTPRAGSMPAAAVSVMESHAIADRTILASIIEMCQRDTLRIEAVGTRAGFLYRLSRQGNPQYEWEHTISKSLPPGLSTIDALAEAIGERKNAIGGLIGAYLRRRGLFHKNPVRTRMANDLDGSGWVLLAGVLAGAGCGLWTALWLDQWWANALIGAYTCLQYLAIATPVPSGMLTPTPAGAREIGRWLGLKESLTRSGPTSNRDPSDPLLAYAVAFDVAQSWLDVAAPAPPWFGSRDESSLRGVDLDAAYHAFMHAPEWGLTGRSEDPGKAAAEPGHELELESLETESPDAEKAGRRRTDGGIQAKLPVPDSQYSSREDAPRPLSTRYERPSEVRKTEETKSGGCLCGCVKWGVGLVAVVVVVLYFMVGPDVFSPRDKPCPLESPPIPTPAQIATAGDLFRDQCVRVRGTVVFHGVEELVLEMNRDEYVQRVTVRDPQQVLDTVPLGRVLTLAGWLRVEEDGTYVVDFVPERESDPGWWQILRENIESLF